MSAEGDDRTDQKQRDLDRYARVSHEGSELTTDQGVKVGHTDDAVKAGERGPTLMEDFHFREKITRFDHERIPERVVHARGAGAYGFFECTESLSDLTVADFLAEKGRRTPVFVRFSTVAGSRGSADTVRDVRGFATKFYTQAGNYDLVGNNMPVFFIQDGIKFPDFVHAVKPEPRNEIPQASSAHDTLWDFVSCQAETIHMIMWLMSDRAIPRSYRMMEGFGVHTFRLVDAAGKGTFVKFHWKPRLGVHSLVWDETQKIAGKDPDFNRRDLWEAIEGGEYPEWDLGLQLVAEEREHDFDFDLLDATKIIPEEDVPVRIVGRMTLNRNPDNFFAETEQVAFHTANVVPGIDFTNDPLLQARNFSYLDTQLIRLGGPNFAQLPVNRPVAEVHHHQRDGYGQHRIDQSPVSYHKNSLGGGCPALAGGPEAYSHFAERVDGQKIQRRSPSFQDHYSQARLFYNSMAEWEREHIAGAFKFELGKVQSAQVREGVIGRLVNVDEELARDVAEGIGVQAPAAGKEAARHDRSSPALSQANQPHLAATRRVAVLAADGVDMETLEPVLDALGEKGVICEILGPHDGELRTAAGGSARTDRALVTMSSVLYDAVLVAGGQESAATLCGNGEAVHYAAEAYRHGKALAALGAGIEVLKKAPMPGVELGGRAEGEPRVRQGVITLTDRDSGSGESGGGEDGGEGRALEGHSGQNGAAAGGGGAEDALRELASELADAVAAHRHFERDVEAVPA